MVPEIKKILYATDLSENSKFALAWAMMLAQKHQAELVLLHVVEDVTGTPVLRTYFSDEDWNRMKKGVDSEAIGIMEKRLAGFCDAAKSEMPECSELSEELVVKHGYPVDVIINEANSRECDLIVMGTLGAGFFTSALMGSTSRRVLRHSKKPVFVIPA